MYRSLSIALLFTSTLAFANPPTPKADTPAPTPVQDEAAKVVQTKLVQPLTAKEGERSRFSRARMPPQARRVRVLDAEPKKDSSGAAYMAFAVDARHGFAVLDVDDDDKGWRKDTLTGCVYVQSGEVFIKRGDDFMAAAMLLGKKSPAPAAHVCKSSDGQLAQN